MTLPVQPEPTGGETERKLRTMLNNAWLVINDPANSFLAAEPFSLEIERELGQIKGCMRPARKARAGFVAGQAAPDETGAEAAAVTTDQARGNASPRQFEPRRWILSLENYVWRAKPVGPTSYDKSGPDVEVEAVWERGRGVLETDKPAPGFWPGDVDGGIPGVTDRKETGPIGAGTPHARMRWFWDRMEKHGKLIEELTGWSPISSTYRFEAAVADAFEVLAGRGVPDDAGSPVPEED